MTRATTAALVLAFGLALCGCEGPRKASRGFHLPDGDPVRGKEAFVALSCHSCHAVEGVDLPAPVADPPLPFTLGGRVQAVQTDGELAGAILDPSHRISFASPAGVQSGRLSRMGDFTEVMTARQLIDIVAFIHQSTTVEPDVMR